MTGTITLPHPDDQHASLYVSIIVNPPAPLTVCDNCDDLAAFVVHNDLVGHGPQTDVHLCTACGLAAHPDAAVLLS